MIVLINKNKLLEAYLEKFLQFEQAANENVAKVKFPNARVVITVDAELESVSELVDAGFAVLAIDCAPNFARACELLGAGARGYANAHMCERHFQDAISSISNGGMWVLPEIICSLIGQLDKPQASKRKLNNLPDASEREEIVAQMVCDGLTNYTIAAELGLSSRTIKSVCAALYAKAGVANRMEFVLKIGGEELAEKLAKRKRTRRK